MSPDLHSRSWKRVAIESPYSGQVARNMEYLQRCILDCLARYETPYASHQMLTKALNDLDPEQRKAGIEAGIQMSLGLDQRIFYLDYGWSDGMYEAKARYESAKVSYIERRIL